VTLEPVTGSSSPPLSPPPSSACGWPA